MSGLRVRASLVWDLFILAGLSAGCAFFWNAIPSWDSWTTLPTYGAILLLVYQVAWMVRNKVRYYDFRLWFVILQYLFIFGRIFLHEFHMDTDIFWNLMEYYSVESMFRASLYGLVYTQAIFTGLFWNYSRDSHEIKRQAPQKGVSGQCMIFVGIVTLMISLPFKISNDITTIQAQSDSGEYVAVVIENGMSYAISMLMPVGVMFLICSPTIRRRWVNVILLAMVIYMGLIMVMSGDRRYSVTALIAVLLCYLQKYKVRLTIKRILLIFLFTQFLLIVLATIRNTRAHVTSLTSFWEQLGESFQTSNIFYETLSEFGLTFFIYAAVVQFFPSVFAFKLGKTYLLGPLTVIPMSGLIFPGLQTNISGHMDCKSITDQALGAALGEEIFCNFAYLAPLFAVIIGVVIARVMRMNIQSPYSTARYYGLFYIMLNLVRSSTTEILRTAVYAVVIPWLLVYIYQSTVGRKTEWQKS